MEKEMEAQTGRPPGRVLLGGLLILLGVVFLLGELLDVRIGHFVWPFVVIGPGVSLFLLALTIDDSSGEAFAAVGGIITTVGLILLYQNLFNHWESWAYAWALVAPTSLGLSWLGYGWVKAKPEARARGRDMVKIGLSIFVVAAIFFELIIGISGFGLGSFSWPLLLIALGLFLVARNLMAAARKV